MKRSYTSLPYTEYTTTAFDSNRLPITKVVIHSTACTLQQAINTFSSPNAQTSAHYIVDMDGKLYAGLEEYSVAYHSGNYEMNQKSIGIENVWYNGIHPSDELYAKSAALVKDICNFYKLPIDKTTIIPHNQVVPTGCPNEISVDKIISLANGTPMNNDSKKATQVDQALTFYKTNGVITDDNSNNYLDGQFLKLVVNQYGELVANRAKAGNWDKVVFMALSGNADSNKVTPQQVYDKIKSMSDSAALQQQVVALQADLVSKLALAKSDCDQQIKALKDKVRNLIA